jgi:hypothetical protein
VLVRKFLLKALPYLLAISAGFLFYILGLSSGSPKDLFFNLSAAFFAIPALYLFYDIAKNISQKKLNKEIFDYAKMQIDREVLPLICDLNSILYPLSEEPLSEKMVSHIISLNRADIDRLTTSAHPIGFYIFKDWSGIMSELHAILRNPYILQRLENEQIIAVLQIIKNAVSFGMVRLSLDGLYTESKAKPPASYDVLSGKGMDKEAGDNRYVLCKHLSEDNFQILDFGDFRKFSVDRGLLKTFDVNKDLLGIYNKEISDFIHSMRSWVDSTGGEFVIDPTAFRTLPRGEF